MLLGSIGYLHTPRRRSPKPFTKRLSHCRAKWTCIFAFSAICSPTAQSLTMIRFAWSWTRSDTFTLREDAPQNRFRIFCHMLTNCSVTYHDPFCVILDSIGYFHTPWRRSTKPFTKRLSHCRAKWTCIFAFSAICSPTAQSLTMIRFAWSWTRSDTFTLCEDTPQNRLRNGWAVVELSELVFSHFLPYAHPLLSHLPWFVLRDPELNRISSHSVKMLRKTIYETV